MLASFFEFWPLNPKITDSYTEQDVQNARIEMETYTYDDDSTPYNPPPALSPPPPDPVVISELEESIREEIIQYENCLKVEYKTEIGEEEYEKKCINLQPNYFGKPLNLVNYFDYSDKYIPEWDKDSISISLLPTICPDKTLDNSLYLIWKEKTDKLMSLLTGTAQFDKPSSCIDIKDEQINNYYDDISNAKYYTTELDTFESDNKTKLKELEKEYIFGGNKDTYEKVYNILSLCITPPNSSCVSKVDNNENDYINEGLPDEEKSEKGRLDFTKSSCTKNEKSISGVRPTYYPPRKTLPPELSNTFPPFMYDS